MGDAPPRAATGTCIVFGLAKQVVYFKITGDKYGVLRNLTCVTYHIFTGGKDTLALDSFIENNDISSTERYLLAIATRVKSQGSFIISTGSQEKGGCSLIRPCSLIRSNTVH